MASYLSVLIQAAEPANYKLNYDEHYMLSVPLATTTTPGIVAFDSDYFVIENGVVKINPAYDGELENKVDKIVPEDRGIFAYVVEKGAYDSITNFSIEISTDVIADTIARRYTDGRLKVGNGVDNADAVNKGQLTAATTDIPKSALASDVRTSLGKADTAYQKPGTGIPETDLSTAVRTKLNKAISRVGISPADWQALPVADRDINTMYFVGPYGTSPNQYFVEWMYFVDTNDQGHWETIGSTQSVDLSNYFTKSEINTLLAGKANIDGVYSGMSVGHADIADQINTDRQIDNADEACPPVVFGTIGGAAEVQNGLMPFPELRGHTIKWNQLIQNGNFASDSGWYAINGSLSVANNKASYTITTVGGDGTNRIVTSDFSNSFISGRKYLICCVATPPTSKTCAINCLAYNDGSIFVATLGTVSSRSFVGAIVTATATKSSSIRFSPDYSSKEVGDVIVFENCECFDLTDIYGAGNEPSTAAEFVRDFPLPYYAYNAGTPISSKSSSVDFVKRNQLNLARTAGTLSGFGDDNPRAFEEGKYYVGLTVNNYYNPGNVSDVVFEQESVSFQNASGGYGVAFPVRVIPGQTFLAETKNVDGNTVAVSWYDADGYLISFGGGSTYYHSATAPANAYWGVMVLQPTVGTHTYTEIQFRLYWSTPNLPYVPYSKQHITLPNIELRSAGSAYDVLYQQGGGKRRIGSYTFTGNETWTDSSGHAYYTNAITTLVKAPSSNDDVANILCDALDATSSNDLYSNGNTTRGIAINTGGYIWIDETTYASIASLTGKTLYYELATETDITTTENPGWTEYAEIDNFGTVKFNQSPAQTIPVPQAYFVRYTVNLVEFLDSLYVHCGGDVSKIALVSP